jgi:predicted O-methyltransferase YrrM
MKKQIPLLILGLLLFIGNSNCLFAKDYLQNRIHPGDKRETTFRLCFEILEHRGAKILVETGTARNGGWNCHGDGCSTLLFAAWANDHEASLFSVDIDPGAINESKAAVSQINPHVQFATQDSISFLRDFDQQIDFLYLDSYDFEPSNPHPSQLHHLNEIEAAYPHLHENTVIMIDDCDLPYGGKGKLAIEFLKAHGWEVLITNYQVILIHSQSKK